MMTIERRHDDYRTYNADAESLRAAEAELRLARHRAVSVTQFSSF
jgi:hypothetical protein